MDRNVLVHRLYSAVDVEGDHYRVMILIKEGKPNTENEKKVPYVFEVKAIELSKGSFAGTRLSNLRNSAFNNSTISAANLLYKVKKTYDKGKNLIEESGKNATTLFNSGTLRFRFIGEKGAERMDNEDNGTRMSNLDIANKMEEKGRPARLIKLATGWERGADGKWRYEESDFRLTSIKKCTFKEGQAKRITDIIPASDNLFKEYPSLRDYLVKAEPMELFIVRGEMLIPM